MRVISIQILLILFTLASTSAQAELMLNKLSACDEIANLYKSMKAGELVKTRTCRPSKSLLEKELLTRSGIDTSQLCFDQFAPASFLEGFSCILEKRSQEPALLCFKQAEAEDIRFYKVNFGEKFASPVSKYISKARSCSASNGDASTAPESLFPPLLTLISRFEIGFTSQLGEKKISPSDSAILHGYATTDPSIPDNHASAIEFVSMYTNSSKYLPTTVQKTVGRWLVLIDKNKRFNEEYNNAVHKNKLPMKFDSMTFKLKNSNNTNTSINNKFILLKELQQNVVNTLLDEGFKTVSDKELQTGGGKSTDEILEEIRELLPFGIRDKSAITTGTTVKMLLNESRPKCAGNIKGENATGVYIFVSNPLPEVASDFGEISINILGMGQCSQKASFATQTYLKSLIEEISNQLFVKLESK